MKINPLYRYGNPADWVSAPVRFFRVGVHTYDDGYGPGYFPVETLRRSLSYWSLCPITVDHPPEFVHNQVDAPIVGAVEDVRLTGEYLSGTAWLHKPSLAADLLQRIERGEALNVSAAMTEGSYWESGNYRGQDFNRVVTNVVPDHLAILPEGEGVVGLTLNCGLNVPPLTRKDAARPMPAPARKAQPNPLRSSRAVAAKKIAAGLAKGEAYRKANPF